MGSERGDDTDGHNLAAILEWFFAKKGGNLDQINTSLKLAYDPDQNYKYEGVKSEQQQRFLGKVGFGIQQFALQMLLDEDLANIPSPLKEKVFAFRQISGCKIPEFIRLVLDEFYLPILN